MFILLILSDTVPTIRITYVLDYVKAHPVFI